VHVQENHAFSKKGVLRGIHIAPWDKMIYVPYGRAFIALVDLRKDSPTFGKHISLEIGDNNRVKVFMPAGIGNSYLILSDEAVYEYQVNEYYKLGAETGVMWNDPEIGIEWPVENPILSDKDQKNPTLKEYKDSL
jgi:dTDP-4-dehydrorhamnose 3,5-epimerase